MVVSAVVVISALTVAMAGPAMSFFIPPMQTDLGLGMVYFGIAFSARQLGFALMGPILGRLTDRFGARPLLVLVGIIAAGVVYTLSLVENEWHLIALLAILGLIGLQGAGGDLYGSVVIAKWFAPAQRGYAMSVAFLGLPLGVFLFMPLTQWSIDTLGWQTAWQYIGLLGGGLIVLAAAFIKPPPALDEASPDSANPVDLTVHWSRAEALRSAAFWKVCVSFGLLMFTISSVAMFRVPHFLNSGFAADSIALAFSSEAIFSIGTASVMGWLIARFQIRHLTAIAFTMPVWMLVLTIYADALWILYASVAVFGIGAASCIILQNTIWPAYFGSEHIGAIRGISMPVTLGFAVIGAPLAGWVNDISGSFVPIWWAAIGSMVVAIFLIVTTPKPNRHQ